MQQTPQIRTIGLLLLLLAVSSPVFLYAQFDAKDDIFRQPLRDPAEQKLPEVDLHEFDSTEWKRLTAGLEYGEVEESESEGTGNPPATNPVVAEILKYILIIGGITLLAWLLFRYFSGSDLGFQSRRAKKTSLQAAVEDLEEDLPTSDLRTPLQQAEQTDDYRLAARLRYLRTIQDLTAGEYVVWTKDKTNGQYVRELRGSSLYRPFRSLTLLFERYWYGRTHINRSEYEQLLAAWQHMQESLISPQTDEQ